MRSASSNVMCMKAVLVLLRVKANDGNLLQWLDHTSEVPIEIIWFVLREAVEHVLKRAFLDDFPCLLHPILKINLPIPSILHFLSYHFISSLRLQPWLVSLLHSSFSHYQITMKGFVACFSMTFLIAPWGNCQFTTLSPVFPGKNFPPD